MSLRMSPRVYAKLQWLLAHSETEIGGFGVANDSKDPLRIHDFVVLSQVSDIASVELDDQGVADFTDDMVDQGYQPFQFLRVWTHTHPGDGANPSSVDHRMFRDKFARCDWAVMLIISRGTHMTGTMSVLVGETRHEFTIPITIDWTMPFEASNHAAWQKDLEKIRTVGPQWLSMGADPDRQLFDYLQEEKRNASGAIQPVQGHPESGAIGERDGDHRRGRGYRAASSGPVGHHGRRDA